MPDRPWKQTERSIARRLGGQRTGPTGRNSPDVVAGWLSVEVKFRAELPHWLQAAMRQAVRNAQPETLPVVVLHQTGQRHDNDLVVLTLRDFCEWFGDSYPDGVSDSDAMYQDATQ